MAHRVFKATLAVTLAVGLCVGLAPAVTAAPSSGSARKLGYGASAYGTYAFVGQKVIAGKTAVAGLACDAQLGDHGENTVGSVDALPLFTTGVINTTADALVDGSAKASRADADVHDVRFLPDMPESAITATEVRAVSETLRTRSGFDVSSAGSVIVDLVIGGTSFPVTPAPNTTIALPGVGHVVLNEQISHIGHDAASLTVNMIHVYVTKDVPGTAKKGTQVIVAHAFTDVAFAAGTLDGHAYGTRATVGKIVLSGPSAKVGLPCNGTNGRLRQNEVAGVELPDAFTVGEVVTTARGKITKSSATGETTATVQAIDVLGGLVSAAIARADAHSFTDGAQFKFSDDGTQFLSLSIEGHPEIGDDVAPNTKLEIEGIGTLWLRREIEKAHSLEIRMIELVLTQDVGGLLEGTDIRVAVAEASAH